MQPLRWRLTVCCKATVASVESFLVGTWLSLVEHSLGVRGVGSSNLPVPTIKISNLSDYPLQPCSSAVVDFVGTPTEFTQVRSYCTASLVGTSSKLTALRFFICERWR